MKPLELTMYPPLSSAVQEAVDWNIEHGWPIYEGFGVEENIPGITAMHAKHLTEPELAAEYHASETEAWRDSAIYLESEVTAQIERRSATLHRFASSPHYFEQP